MESLIEKVIKAGIVGALLYICWHILPRIKDKLVKKGEHKLEKRGLLIYYKFIHKMIKTFLYIILAIMILAPIIFFIVIYLNSK